MSKFDEVTYIQQGAEYEAVLRTAVSRLIRMEDEAISLRKQVTEILVQWEPCDECEEPKWRCRRGGYCG